MKSVDNNSVIFATGPAGTGKTFIAIAMALQALRQAKTQNILLTRPAVQAGEDLGFLPGELDEKLEPYTRPFEAILQEMCDEARVHNLKETGAVTYQPLGFLRGQTIRSSWAVLDEAQNATEDQLRMFLTRLGQDSKALITGDPEQTDLQRPSSSALSSAQRLLGGVNDITFVDFSEDDIVRHEVVKDVIKVYRGEFKRRARQRENEEKEIGTDTSSSDSKHTENAPSPEENMSRIAKRYQQHSNDH